MKRTLGIREGGCTVGVSDRYHNRVGADIHHDDVEDLKAYPYGGNRDYVEAAAADSTGLEKAV